MTLPATRHVAPPLPRIQRRRCAARASGLRRQVGVLFATLLAVWGASACGRDAEPGGLPADTPVVLVIVDTLSASHLATYGYGLPTAPNFTRFTERATLFENHTTQCNSTFPSIASVMTGLYPKTHKNLLPVPTAGTYQKARPGASLAERLRAAGYHTLAVASHPSWEAEPRDDEVRSGWHEFSVIPPDVSEPRTLWANAGFTNERLFGLLEAWKERRDGPLFVWAHYFDPHTDLQPLVYAPPPAWRDQFVAAHLGAAGLEEYVEELEAREPVERSEYIDTLEPGPRRDALRLANGRSLYDAEIAYCDHELERFFQYLRERGLWDRALVIIAADHGENLEGRVTERGGIDFTHQRLYEPVVRTPLAIKLPGQTHGQRVAALSQNIDLLPTILELLDLPAGAALEGRSLASLLGQDLAAERARELDAIHERVYSESWDNLEKAVRDPDWKYFDSDGAYGRGLFAWRSDPAELDNLAAEPETQVAQVAPGAQDALAEQAALLASFRPQERLQLACLPEREPYEFELELELGNSAVLEAFDAQGRRAGTLSDEGRRFQFATLVEDEPVELHLVLKNRKPPFTWSLRKRGRAPQPSEVFCGRTRLDETTAIPLFATAPGSPSAGPEGAEYRLRTNDAGDQLEIVLAENSAARSRIVELLYEHARYDKRFELLEASGLAEPRSAAGGRLVLEAGPGSARAVVAISTRDRDLLALLRTDGRWPAASSVELDLGSEDPPRPAAALRVLWPFPGDRRLNAALLAAPDLDELPPGSLAIWREGGGRLSFDAARLDPDRAAELRALGYLGDD